MDDGSPQPVATNSGQVQGVKVVSPSFGPSLPTVCLARSGADVKEYA